MSSEEDARQIIDALLTKAVWQIANADKVNIHTSGGVVIRIFTLRQGRASADYLVYIDGTEKGVRSLHRAWISEVGRRGWVLITKDENDLRSQNGASS